MMIAPFDYNYGTRQDRRDSEASYLATSGIAQSPWFAMMLEVRLTPRMGLVKSSFLSVNKWVEDVRSERGPDVIIFLVANKIDLEKR